MPVCLFIANCSRALIGLLLLVSPAALAQSAAWQKTSLGGAASVEFPGAAVPKVAQGQQAYFLKAGETLYITLVQPNGIKSDATDSELSTFYGGQLEGMLEIAGGGQVLESKPFSVGGFTGMEAQYTMPKHVELPPIKFTRVVSVNGTVYTQNYWTSTEHAKLPAAKAERDRFFASFQPGAEKNAEGDGANAAGKRTGRVFFYVLLAAGIFWLVRRMNRSKKS